MMVARRSPLAVLWHVLVLLAICALGRAFPDAPGAHHAENVVVTAARSEAPANVAVRASGPVQVRIGRALRPSADRPTVDGRGVHAMTCTPVGPAPAGVTRVGAERSSAHPVARLSGRALAARGPPSVA